MSRDKSGKEGMASERQTDRQTEREREKEEGLEGGEGIKSLFLAFHPASWTLFGLR